MEQLYNWLKEKSIYLKKANIYSNDSFWKNNLEIKFI